MDERSFGGCEIDQQLWDAVARKDDWTFTESSLQKLVKDGLVHNELPQLLSMLGKIILECNSNCYALYKITIIMKYLCSQYPEKFSALLVERSNVLETLRNYSYIDYCGKDRGINVRVNAEQLLDFIGSEQKSGESGEPEIISTVQSSLDSATNQLLQTLSSIGTINSEAVLQNLRSEVIQFNKFLPGFITHETYTGLDKTPKIDDILYGQIVERIVDTFDNNWPMIGNNLDPAIERLIVVEGASFPMFHETLITLTDSLKESTNARVVDSIVLLLEKLIKSEALFSSITEASKLAKKAKMESVETENAWQNTLQVLVSLPNRIANKLGGKVADCFLADNYAKIVSLHIGRGISFLHSVQRKLGIQPHIQMLSRLISKAVIVLGAHRFEDLFDVISEWCSENPDNIRNCINGVLSHIDRAAIHPIAVSFLRQRKPSIVVQKIFGDLLTNSNWKHVFTVKIPLMSFYKDEHLLRNLIAYLSDDKHALKDLLIKLLEIWGDRSAMNHTSLEQHEYITKLILMSVRELKGSLKPNEKDTARRLLFSGTSAHLESTQNELRAMGMITGEIVVENLNDSEDEPKLKYDYDGMPKEARELVERLQILGRVEKRAKKSSEEERCVTVGTLVFSDVGLRKLHELGVNCGIVADTIHTAVNIEPVDHKECVETKVSKTERARKSIDQVKSHETIDSKAESGGKSIDQVESKNDDEDLDSDDDLVSYDMSNDTPASEKLRPRYLRDFKENLINAQSNTDPNIFEESMRAGEELILSQLPDDDASLGIELLEILISLREISCVDDFELLKFNCCIAIAVVYPKEAAKYLCNEFHKKIGNYSIKDRLFILDILGEAARKLSKIEVKPKIDDKQPERTERKRKVTKPVSLAIDMNNCKKYETLYDDDFEIIPESNKSTTDWEEIVTRRIKSNTRIFAHASKTPVTTMNKFNDVASSFFYPLLYGFRQKETCMYNTPATFEDQENILLVNYLKTLSTIMMAAENCVIVPKMAKELLELAWALRYHSQAKVRLCVIENIASVVITLPKEGLTTELMELIYEFRAWLCDVSEDGIRGDPDSSCRALGKNVIALIESIFHSTLKEL